MGRPRHQPRTADDLLDAAERLIEAEGVGALSLRRVAESAGTTTRAVYSLFGSKDGLVTALGQRAFELLGEGVDRVPQTDDAAGDLVEAGISVFRRFSLEHPSLFRVAVQRTLPGPGYATGFGAEAGRAMRRLEQKVQRLEDAGILGGRTVREATTAFHAMCEGLAALELRGLLPEGHEGAAWRDGLGTLVRGFAAVPAEEPASLPTV
ncbi:MAG TPA: TetR/AcrR family transcriptional regulator [Gaiellaceae bacterium]|nr:TetR/AcrR family transcriptional regulator [Gaiellaceae bacterium]